MATELNEFLMDPAAFGVRMPLYFPPSPAEFPLLTSASHIHSSHSSMVFDPITASGISVSCSGSWSEVAIPLWSALEG
jgi:hypothetical protein